MKTITLHVAGTHCPSCKIFIEDVLNEQIGVRNAQVDLKNELVSLETELEDSHQRIAEILTEKIKHNGYTLSVERQRAERKSAIWQALPVGLTVLALFFIVQKSGLLNLGLGASATPMTSLVIGLVASVSSCLAVVGGLVLSLSATVAQDKVPDTKPMLLFHGGRLASFALLGGALGALGGAIGISFTFTALLGLLAATVMILLGLNLIGAFRKNLVALPAHFFSFFRRVEHKSAAPAVLGFGSFFLPCGFTQAMQVAALSSGSFIAGSLIMTAFALGTLPMLALLSFGAASFAHSKHAALFLQSAGVVVIGLGAFALLSGLAGLGVMPPLFNI